MTSDQLPWDDIGVVLHHGECDAVAAAEVIEPPAIGDGVDARRRAPGEHQFLGCGGVDEGGDLAPRSFVQLSRFGGERVRPRCTLALCRR